MYAAVLHTIGTVPRYEEFPEPVIENTNGEAIVYVHAASLKPIDKQLASGSHYASPRKLPCVCGSDGVGHLDDGQRVFFGGPRPPHGAMAQRTVVPRAFTFPVPENLDDETAAAMPNPGISAWLSLTYRAKVVPGENVLILGATGVTGNLKFVRLILRSCPVGTNLTVQIQGVDPTGALVPLEAQDRSRWQHGAIAEGLAELDIALAQRRRGPYQLQAAIAALHARARRAEDTDWKQIAALYGGLLAEQPGAVVELNAAVALAMAEGPERGLAWIDRLEQADELRDYHLLPAARADLLRRLGRPAEAALAYASALALVRSPAERRYLERRLAECHG